jgi:hypothetical protein
VTLGDADRITLNEDPLKWACAHAADSTIKTEVCSKRESLVSAAKKEKITYYVESLCPDSVTAMQKLDQAIVGGLLRLYDVDLVLAGNAKVNDSKLSVREFTCQHGPNECYGNSLESCIMKHSSTTLGGLKSVTCMFEQTNTDGNVLDGALITCASIHKAFYPDVVIKCAHGAEGNALSYDAVQATPAHTFIPWETVSGATLSENDRTLLMHDPLRWACANAPDSDSKKIVCGKSVRDMIASLRRKVIK